MILRSGSSWDLTTRVNRKKSDDENRRLLRSQSANVKDMSIIVFAENRQTGEVLQAVSLKY